MRLSDPVWGCCALFGVSEMAGVFSAGHASAGVGARLRIAPFGDRTVAVQSGGMTRLAEPQLQRARLGCQWTQLALLPLCFVVHRWAFTPAITHGTAPSTSPAAHSLNAQLSANSPRANIDEVETDVVEIEAKLDKLVKLCSGMIEAGRAYVSANKLFVSGIRDLSQQCEKDLMISECLEKCGERLQEIVNYHTILFDQAQRSVKQQLHSFVKDDIRKFKDTKKQFDKVREDMEIAQVKNAQAPRNKPHEVEEATSTLTLTRKCFRHLALDYVLQINVLQAKKKFEILDAMLSFMHAEYTLFHQGYHLLDQIDPYMKKLAADLDQLVIDSAMEKREMEHKHATIQQRTLMQLSLKRVKQAQSSRCKQVAVVHTEQRTPARTLLFCRVAEWSHFT
ncbi:hypothetical protein COCON_G00177650 [Conger conger]|uniref:Arf-GAP with coiled-coil, ANK repeat and PH domain-containing protein n=1 Tax=Conger conger TaxID=82655 RepID=A0A9Q1D560_CONCO|nr:hypothetical protein COCON_G00177650 [Conger conger]